MCGSCEGSRIEAPEKGTQIVDLTTAGKHTHYCEPDDAFPASRARNRIPSRVGGYELDQKRIDIILKDAKTKRHLATNAAYLMEYLDDVATMLELGINPNLIAQDIRLRAARFIRSSK